MTMPLRSTSCFMLRIATALPKNNLKQYGRPISGYSSQLTPLSLSVLLKQEMTHTSKPMLLQRQKNVDRTTCHVFFFILAGDDRADYAETFTKEKEKGTFTCSLSYEVPKERFGGVSATQFCDEVEKCRKISPVLRVSDITALRKFLPDNLSDMDAKKILEAIYPTAIKADQPVVTPPKKITSTSNALTWCCCQFDGQPTLAAGYNSEQSANDVCKDGSFVKSIPASQSCAVECGRKFCCCKDNGDAFAKYTSNKGQANCKEVQTRRFCAIDFDESCLAICPWLVQQECDSE